MRKERLCHSPKDINSVGPEPGFGPRALTSKPELFSTPYPLCSNLKVKFSQILLRDLPRNL